MEVKTTSPQKTQKIAQKLSQNLEGGDVIALFGDLGAGKTTFVQGLAKGLGIKKRIISPSFVFMRSYPFICNNQSLIFHHVDLYRAQKSVDSNTLGLDEIFSKNSIVAIEWAEKMKKQLPQKRIDVFIDRMGENTRRIKITPAAYSSSDRAKRGNREVTSNSRLSFPRPLRPPASPRGERSKARKRESRNWIPDQAFEAVSPQAESVRNDNMVSSRLRSNINKAARILRSGGVIIFPTDTVYGISCRFDDQKAINRIYQIKGSSKSQPFPILVSSIKQVENLADINPQARELMKKYWPGGLTIILPSRHPGSSNFRYSIGNSRSGIGNAQKIGFRMPNSKLILDLIDEVGIPIIGTSANIHGNNAVKSSKDLDQNLINQVDYVVEGECERGIESTVVDATFDPPNIIRQGAITLR